MSNLFSIFPSTEIFPTIQQKFQQLDLHFAKLTLIEEIYDALDIKPNTV